MDERAALQHGICAKETRLSTGSFSVERGEVKAQRSPKVFPGSRKKGSAEVQQGMAETSSRMTNAGLECRSQQQNLVSWLA